MIALSELLAPPRSRVESCGAHGEYESRCYMGMNWTKCPVCATEEKVRKEAEEVEKEKAAKREAWERKLGQAQIPERFRDRKLTNYQAYTPAQLRALRFAEEYAESFRHGTNKGRSAVFVGTPGTGKTHLSAGIALRIMHEYGKTVVFSTVSKAIRRIKETWSKGSDETETQAINVFVFPDLLILDEVGVQFGSDTEQKLLFDILNERYERNKPTLFLSNLSVEEVKGYLGERIFDRIREGGGEAIVFNWESYRGKG